jgi:hypothetical protein
MNTAAITTAPTVRPLQSSYAHPDQRNAGKELPSRLLPCGQRWNPVKGNLTIVLWDGDTVRGTSGGAQGFRVRLKNGLRAPRGNRPLCSPHNNTVVVHTPRFIRGGSETPVMD